MMGIENGRAKHAFKQSKGKNPSYVKQMPMMIQNNGLAQTLAFYKSKADRKPIIDSLEDWIFKSNQDFFFIKDVSQTDLIETAISCTQEDYQLLTVEIMKYLQWMRRFVETEGKVD